ncbi:hypothetical protein LINGRAHAP2_LOCUS4650 [Linum grandiflorum]
MGDLRPWSPEVNGGDVAEERPSSSSSPSAPIDAANWKRAEAAAQLIIAQVQPTLVSEERRKTVIDYVQRLIRNSIGCEVLPFGSVPLKTYLPDGDIDLTAFGGANMEESLANDVRSILELEDQNTAAEFVVKDVQLIRAEVKLVKCLVQNIVVDISFNQLGGLCTLCFLEEVDRFIGRDHIFKKSIILVKAWCYYESRILGAHHGLISTYALETLVLYIFQRFHSSLDGPLAVLYNFLDYFSKFDWDSFCISLNGPIRISSLPEVVVDFANNDGFDRLLSHEFLKECVDRFSVSVGGSDTNPRSFPPKHLNIVDPLKENNNLGRSVSKGNFYRIKSAFGYGARKLGRILSQPELNVAEELSRFFFNTLHRHVSGQRPDVQDHLPLKAHCGYSAGSTFPGSETCQDNQRNFESEFAEASGINGECRWDTERTLQNGNIDAETNLNKKTLEANTSRNGCLISEHRLSGDAKDLATSRIQHLSISNDGTGYSAVGNGDVLNGNPELTELDSSKFNGKGIPSATHVVSNGLDEKHVEVVSPAGSLNLMVEFPCESIYPSQLSCQPSACTVETLEASNSLSDLSGDYESNLHSLGHGRWWYDYTPSSPVPPMSPKMLAHFQSKSSWHGMRRAPHYRQNANGVCPRPVFNAPLIRGAMFGTEDGSRPRGTGTYFPNVNHYNERPFSPRGRNQVPLRSPRGPFHEPRVADRSSHELPQWHGHVDGWKSPSLDSHQSTHIEPNPYSNVNGVADRIVEFGSLGHLPLEIPTAEREGQHTLDLVVQHSPSVSEGTPKPEDPSAVDKDKGVRVHSFRLKDDEDFPPLSDNGGKGLAVWIPKKPERQKSSDW